MPAILFFRQTEPKLPRGNKRMSLSGAHTLAECSLGRNLGQDSRRVARASREAPRPVSGP